MSRLVGIESSMLQLYPAIDIRGGQCVRLRQGDYAQETVFASEPAEMALRWKQDGAEWLHLVDLDGAKAGCPVNTEPIRRIVEQTALPCQLGGGIRDEAAIQLMLEEIGVSRVIVGTQALKQPEWFRAMALKFPGRIALGLDARDGFVATEGWLDVSHKSAKDLALSYADLPLAAVIYTNIANDGMMQGVDRTTIDQMIELAALGFPVIASGGVTTLDDVRNLTIEHASQSKLIGAIIGRALYENTIHLGEALQITRK